MRVWEAKNCWEYSLMAFRCPFIKQMGKRVKFFIVHEWEQPRHLILSSSWTSMCIYDTMNDR